PRIPPPQKPAPSESDTARRDAAKALTSLRKTTAWALHRWPMERRPVRRRTKVHLPRSYLGRDGEDVRVVHPGTDLNQFVYRHYDREAEGKEGALTNYVSADKVSDKKHEYLGPDPRVAGFFFDVDGEIHVCWWDRFLEDQWMDRGKWTMLEVEMNENGDWV
ncbi:hypothetical protein OF83DRAFT_1031502, partial [Amylostereum chailletii]